MANKGSRFDTFHLKEFQEFLDLLNKESDRGAVLVAAAMLDDLLERSIRGLLIEQKEVNQLFEGLAAPLGLFRRERWGRLRSELYQRRNFGNANV